MGNSQAQRAFLKRKPYTETFNLSFALTDDNVFFYFLPILAKTR